MSDSIKSLLFAALLCLACSLLLTAASSGLRGFQQQNIALDKQKNILKSVGLIDPYSTRDRSAIEALYAAKIKSFWVDEAGCIITGQQQSRGDLPIYLYLEKDDVAAYVIPIDSRGLWGRIMGYLALQNDGSTISGFTVYKHSETPGLGGEIEQRWFQRNFVGKKIVNRAGAFVSIGIAKGSAREALDSEAQLNYVDGISGATLTGKLLSAGIRDTLLDYEPVSVQFRSHQAYCTQN